MAENVSDDFEISFEQIFKDLKFSKIFYVQSVHEIPNLQIKKIMRVSIICIFFYVNIFLLKFIPRGLKLTLTDSAIFVACDARSVRDWEYLDESYLLQLGLLFDKKFLKLLASCKM